MASKMKIDATKVWDAPEATLVTVGHNRTMMWTYEGGFRRFNCYLHGHCIARIKPHGAEPSATVHFNDSGYLTATTCKAMSEFAAAFGVSCGVSRAGGEMSVRYKQDGEYVSRKAPDGRITFAAERY